MIEELTITNKSPESLEKLSKLRLNIGCGDNKIEGFINIDGEESLKPDIVHDIRKAPLPFNADYVDEIVFFHCIEHIEEQFHDSVLSDFWRVLKPGGTLLISYPEFLKAAEGYATNKRGQREFFKKVIYGRQSHKGDYHVTIMDTPFFLNRLRRIGFEILRSCPEPEPNFYNTVVHCRKGNPWIDRETLLKREIYEA